MKGNRRRKPERPDSSPFEVLNVALTSSTRASRTLVVICSCILAILVVAALSLAGTVLIPVALATMFTFVLAPFATRLQHAGLGRIPAVLIVTAIAFLVVAGFGAVVVNQARSLAIELPGYRDNIRTKLDALGGENGGFFADVQKAVDEIHDAFFGGDARARPTPVQVQP